MSDYVIWGDHPGATQSFFGAYTGQWYLSCYISKWWELAETIDLDDRDIWIYNYLTADTDANGGDELAPQMVIFGEANDAALVLGDHLKAYVDANSIDESTVVSYICKRGTNDVTKEVSYNEMINSLTSDGKYAVLEFPRDTYISGFGLR